MNVADIMTKEVKTGTADDTFAQVAKVMRENHISSVIVMGDRGPAGIVTERDIVSLVAAGLDAVATKVGERMTTDLATVTSNTDIAEAAQVMADRGIRHLPVVERGKLLGIVSIRDLTAWAVEEITGGYELADMEGSQAALSAAVEVKRKA